MILSLILLNSCSKDSENVLQEKKTDELLLQFKFDLIDFTSTHKKSDFYLKNENIENVAEEELKQLRLASIELIKSYGISENEIIEDLGSLDNPIIIEAGLAIAGIEASAKEGIELIDINDNTSLLTGEKIISLQILQKSQVFDCALQAAGITAIGDLIQNGIKGMSKSAVRSVLKKVFTKYLGYVSAAIAAYEFGDCMGWY